METHDDESPKKEYAYIPAEKVRRWVTHAYPILIATLLLVGYGLYKFKEPALTYVTEKIAVDSVEAMQAEMRTLAGEYVKLTNEIVQATADGRKGIIDRRAYVVGRINTLAAKMDPAKIPEEAKRFVRFVD